MSHNELFSFSVDPCFKSSHFDLIPKPHAYQKLSQILIWVSVAVNIVFLKDDARRTDQDGHREDPQEQAVHHHRHVLPVLDDLKQDKVKAR